MAGTGTGSVGFHAELDRSIQAKEPLTEKRLRFIVAQTGNDPRFLNALGLTLFHQGALTEALGLLRKAVKEARQQVRLDSENLWLKDRLKEFEVDLIEAEAAARS